MTTSELSIDQETEMRIPIGTRLFASLISGSGGSLLGLAGLFIAFSLTADNFLSQRNLINVVDQVTVLGILAVGATFVVLTGGIDLSVGAVMALSGMAFGWTTHQAGWPTGLAMLAAVAVGALAGLVNGLGVTQAKLPPFIATLAMLSIARGLANIITDGQNIFDYPSWFQDLSRERWGGWISITILTLIVITIVATLILRYRPVGRSVYAIGGSEEVARLSGIRVKRVTTGVYVLAGALAGVASLVLASRLDGSQPRAGSGIELDVIAAVVIGGASLIGGVGRISGTIIGVFTIGVLRNGLNLLGVSSFLQQIVIGVVIALAVMVDVLRRRAS